MTKAVYKTENTEKVERVDIDKEVLEQSTQGLTYLMRMSKLNIHTELFSFTSCNNCILHYLVCQDLQE